MLSSKMLLRQASRQMVARAGTSTLPATPSSLRLSSSRALPSLGVPSSAQVPQRQPYERHPKALFSTSRWSSSDASRSPSPSTSEASSSMTSESSSSSTPSSSASSATSDDSSTPPRPANESNPDTEDPFSAAASEELLNAPSTSRQAIGRVERRLSITFTCTVPDCGHRSTHEFSRHAYEKGIVLVQCPGCNSRHLIADHLGWFNSDDLTQGGKYKTIEALMASKGEQVARAKVLPDGTVEVDVPDEDSKN